MKILSVVGARPNFIKLAAVASLFKERFQHVIVHTGQHYDYEMSKIFFDQLSIPEPDYHLGVGNGSHAYQTGEMMKRTENVLMKERPALVVVYGDTNSTLAGALASVKAGFKVAHVEAGLRSFELEMPEEINRRVVDQISHLLFAPTQVAIENLKKESVMGKVFLTGDVHADMLFKWMDVAKRSSVAFERLPLNKGEYIVVTIHRIENVENPYRLKNILTSLKKLSEHYKIVFPVHPRTNIRIAELGLRYLIEDPNIILTKPLGYIDFIKLVASSNKVLTDSGGVQREAYLLRKPVIVLRDRTEWVELVEKGWVLLLNPVHDININFILDFNPSNYPEGLLGDGRASERIARIVEIFLEEEA